MTKKAMESAEAKLKDRDEEMEILKEKMLNDDSNIVKLRWGSQWECSRSNGQLPHPSSCYRWCFRNAPGLESGYHQDFLNTFGPLHWLTDSTRYIQI